MKTKTVVPEHVEVGHATWPLLSDFEIEEIRVIADGGADYDLDAIAADDDYNGDDPYRDLWLPVTRARELGAALIAAADEFDRQHATA